MVEKKSTTPLRENQSLSTFMFQFLSSPKTRVRDLKLPARGPQVTGRPSNDSRNLTVKTSNFGCCIENRFSSKETLDLWDKKVREKRAAGKQTGDVTKNKMIQKSLKIAKEE
jgi:hypothetical protein